jgi:ribosomal protein L37AE/L43A
MKKIAILLMIAFAGIFIASCVMDHVYYCPYCGKGNITETSEGVYKCENPSCGKTFGAKQITKEEE